MAFDEELCLYSHEFESNIRATWQKLQVEKDFFDVTLSCGDKQVEAHKFIISSSSSVFKSILKQNLNKHSIIYLRGVNYKHLKYLVDFMYQGEVSIAQTELESFLALAKELKIKGLDEEISQLPSNKNDDHHLSAQIILPQENDILNSVKEFNESDLVENCNVSTRMLTEETNDQDEEQNEPITKIRDFQKDNDINNGQKKLNNYNIPKRILAEGKNDNNCDPNTVLSEENNDIAIEQNEPIPKINKVHEDSYDYDDNHEPEKHVINRKVSFNIRKQASVQERILEEENNASNNEPKKHTIKINLKKLRKVQEENNDSDDNEPKKQVIKRKVSSDIRTQALILFKKEGVWSCSKCDKHFGSYSGLYCHDSRVHRQVSFSCDHCDYRVTRKTILKEHIDNKHKGVRYPCDLCGQKSTTKSSLKIHVEAMHKAASRSCDKCDYITTTQINMKAHKDKVHEKIRYACDNCDYKATRKESLDVHVDAIHKCIRYTCNQCDYSAQRKSTLKNHKETIHGDVLYACDQCDHLSGSKISQAKHTQEHHNSNKS